MIGKYASIATDRPTIHPSVRPRHNRASERESRRELRSTSKTTAPRGEKGIERAGSLGWKSAGARTCACRAVLACDQTLTVNSVAEPNCSKATTKRWCSSAENGCAMTRHTHQRGRKGACCQCDGLCRATIGTIMDTTNLKACRRGLGHQGRHALALVFVGGSVEMPVRLLFTVKDGQRASHWHPHVC